MTLKKIAQCVFPNISANKGYFWKKRTSANSNTTLNVLWFNFLIIKYEKNDEINMRFNPIASFLWLKCIESLNDIQ